VESAVKDNLVERLREQVAVLEGPDGPIDAGPIIAVLKDAAAGIEQERKAYAHLFWHVARLWSALDDIANIPGVDVLKVAREALK
jgi:hypothetical protein